MPEILHMLLSVREDGDRDDVAPVNAALLDLLRNAVIDLVLCEAVDILNIARPLSPQLEEQCFDILLKKAVETGAGLNGTARRFALEGAFRFAVGIRRHELQLLAHLLSVKISDDPLYLAGAAKIVGVAYAHWREPGLITLLEELTTIPEAYATAHFELGMAKLSEALEQKNGVHDGSLFLAAQTEFKLAAQSSCLEAEAQLYADCLTLIHSFHEGADSQALDTIYQSVRMSAFQITAMQGVPVAPNWLGARHAAAACWQALTTRLKIIVEQLNQPSWWNPQLIIEQHLMTAYCASRSVFVPRGKESLDGLIRPRIARQMADKEGLIHQLKIWIEQNTNHDLRPEADILVSQIEAFIHEPNTISPRPSEAAPDWSSIAAFIDKTAATERVKQVFLTVLASAITLNMENMSAAALNVIERCHRDVSTHPDYAENPRGAQLFDVALYWTVQFIQNRLELTQKDDASLSYLFEQEDSSLPTEDALQADYYRFISAYAAGTDLEPTNVGSGRADLRMRSSGERLVIEVKREAQNCTFDYLSLAYASQTTDYQNVSIRIGFLLVLDQCTPNKEGTPHISTLFDIKLIERPGEAVPRAIVIVRVPGRRKRPSDLTRLAQTKRRHHR